MFAVVRSAEDLAVHGNRIAELYQGWHRLQKADGVSGWQPLLGVWVCPRLVTAPPTRLHLINQEEAAVDLLCDSTSWSTLWALCWTSESKISLTQSQLISALTYETSKRTEQMGTMIPVFASDMPGAKVSLQVRRLRLDFADLVAEPVFQERSTGRFQTANTLAEATRTPI